VTNYRPYYPPQYPGAQQARGIGDALARARDAVAAANQAFTRLAPVSQPQQILPMVDPNAINYAGMPGTVEPHTRLHVGESAALGFGAALALGSLMGAFMWKMYYQNKDRWIAEGKNPEEIMIKRANRYGHIWSWVTWSPVWALLIYCLGAWQHIFP